MYRVCAWTEVTIEFYVQLLTFVYVYKSVDCIIIIYNIFNILIINNTNLLT